MLARLAKLVGLVKLVKLVGLVKLLKLVGLVKLVNRMLVRLEKLVRVLVNFAYRRSHVHE